MKREHYRYAKNDSWKRVREHCEQFRSNDIILIKSKVTINKVLKSKVHYRAKAEEEIVKKKRGF